MCSTLLKHSLEARIKLTFNVCLKILINPAFYETCTRILSLKTNVLLLDENGGERIELTLFGSTTNALPISYTFKTQNEES